MSSINNTRGATAVSDLFNTESKSTHSHNHPRVNILGVNALNNQAAKLSEPEARITQVVTTRPLPSDQTGQAHGFKEVTQNMTNVDQLLAEVCERNEELNELVEALGRGDWDSKAFDDVNLFPLLALRAYSENKITQEQFSTVLFYLSIRNSFDRKDVTVFSLYDENGNLNQEAADMIKETFEVPLFDKDNSIRQTAFGSSRSYLSGKFDQWLDLVAKLPKDQQTFFITPLKLRPDLMLFYDICISEATYYRENVNIFNKVLYSETRYQMVPSLGMVQAFHRARSQGKEVQLTPVVGLSSVDRIYRNALTHTRDVGLEFPGYQLPKTADGINCLHAFLFGTIHDAVYHGLVVSSIPRSHQIAYAKVYEIVTEIMKEIGESPELHVLREVAIDMDCTEYYRNFTFDLAKIQQPDAINLIFWQRISELFAHAYVMLIADAIPKIVEANPNCWSPELKAEVQVQENLTALMNKMNVPEEIAKRMYQVPEIVQLSKVLDSVEGISIDDELMNEALSAINSECNHIGVDVNITNQFQKYKKRRTD